MEELTGFEPALMVLQTISLTNLDTTPPEKMAGTSGLEPGFASVKGSCPEPFGPKGHIGRRDGSRTRMDIYPTASEAALYTSFSTRRKL